MGLPLSSTTTSFKNKTDAARFVHNTILNSRPDSQWTITTSQEKSEDSSVITVTIELLGVIETQFFFGGLPTTSSKGQDGSSQSENDQ